MRMAILIDESLNKLSKTDLVTLVVNMQDKMETMKSNLVEEVQKLNTNFGILNSDFSAARIDSNSLNERLTVMKW